MNGTFLLTRTTYLYTLLLKFSLSSLFTFVLMYLSLLNLSVRFGHKTPVVRTKILTTTFLCQNVFTFLKTIEVLESTRLLPILLLSPVWIES